MSDTIRPKADFDTVQSSMFAVIRKHRKAALMAGLTLFEFMRSESRMGAMKAEEESTCILLGWSADEFYAEDHRQIMESMAKEN
jgi:hypothetical protein